jgi:O-antigen ligase
MPGITTAAHSRLNSALYGYFLAVMAWAPLPLASNRDWSTRLLAYLLLAGLVAALGFWASGHLRATPALRRALPVLAALAAVQVWVGVQLVLGISVAPESTQLALLLGCGLVAAFTLVLLLVDSRERVLLTTRVMIWCGVFQAFFAGMMMMSDVEQIALLEKTFSRGAASGTYVNRNHLAGFLEMNLGIGVGMLVAQLHRYPAENWREFWRRTIDTILSRKFRLRLYLAIMVIALVLTRSRMGNTAFFTSLLVCGVLGLVLQQRVTRGAVIFFVSILLIDLYIVGNFFGVEEVVQRMQNPDFQGDKRDVVARDTVVMWRDHFWAGTGADTFYTAYIEGGYKSPDSLWYRHAHNDYLEIGSGFGFIGFALLGAAVLSSLWQAIQAQRLRHSRVMQGLGFGCMMAVVSILIHSFADFNLHITANALWFVVVLALAWVARYADEHGNSHHSGA